MLDSILRLLLLLVDLIKTSVRKQEVENVKKEYKDISSDSSDEWSSCFGVSIDRKPTKHDKESASKTSSGK